MQILQIFFSSYFASPMVCVCAAVLTMLAVWVALHIASNRKLEKILAFNLDCIDEKLNVDPNNADLHHERAVVLMQSRSVMSALADLEKAFVLGRSAESLKKTFRLCYWHMRVSDVAIMTNWAKCKAAAPNLCEELQKDEPNVYQPAFLIAKDRIDDLINEPKIEMLQPARIDNRNSRDDH